MNDTISNENKKALKNDDGNVQQLLNTVIEKLTVIQKEVDRIGSHYKPVI